MFSNLISRRMGFLLCTATAVLLTALVGYLLMHRLQTDSVQVIQESIQDWQPTLTGIRWMLIGLLALSWNHLIGWLASTGRLSAAKASQLTDFRWRFVMWLVLIELVLGQGVIAKSINLAAGMIG